MATATRSTRSAREATRLPAAGEHRIVLEGVGWDLYERLCESIGERQHIRLAFDGEALEILTVGYPHERFREMLGKIVATVTRVRNIPRKTAGEMTWKRPEVRRGLQADECYYFLPEKFTVVEAAFARGSAESADYPIPDLAIEIDLSEPEIDRPGIYASLRVAEVWRFDGRSCTIELLQDDGTYVRAEQSRFLPLRPADLLRWLVQEDYDDELAWELRLERWARRLRRRPA